LGGPTEWDLHLRELTAKICKYARLLKVRVISPGYWGRIPREFQKLHPDRRGGEVLKASAGYRLHPSIWEYDRIYGTDHLHNVDPYPETRPGRTERLELKVAFGEAVMRAMKEADPKGI